MNKADFDGIKEGATVYVMDGEKIASVQFLQAEVWSEKSQKEFPGAKIPLGEPMVLVNIPCPELLGIEFNRMWLHADMIYPNYTAADNAWQETACKRPAPSAFKKKPREERLHYQ